MLRLLGGSFVGFEFEVFVSGFNLFASVTAAVAYPLSLMFFLKIKK